MPKSERITLKLVSHGETTIEVDRAEYEAAKADGELDHFIDPYASDMDEATVIIEPDGTLIDPWADISPRYSLLGSSVTDAVAAILQSVQSDVDCVRCLRSSTACPRHLAEALVAAVRQEDLVVMPLSAADEIVVRAVEHGTKRALSEAADEIDRDGGTVLTARWAADVLREKAGLPPLPADRT